MNFSCYKFFSRPVGPKISTLLSEEESLSIIFTLIIAALSPTRSKNETIYFQLSFSFLRSNSNPLLT